MIEVYYNENEMDKVKINVEVNKTEDGLEQLIYDMGAVISGIINMAVVKTVEPEEHSKVADLMRKALVGLLKLHDTDIDEFKKCYGIEE